MRCTLLCKTREEADIEHLIETSLQELVETDLIRLRDDDSYESTKLGAAIVASSFSPDDGIFVYEELKRALQAFVMDGEMHVFYMFTPLSVAMNTNIDWLIFRDQLDLLDESGIRALLFVGVQPGFVNNMYVVPKKRRKNGTLLIMIRVQTGRNIKEDDPKQLQLSRIYRRAYAAFQLRDLSNEIPLSTIARRYNVPRGVVQTLAQTCHGFAAGNTHMRLSVLGRHRHVMALQPVWSSFAKIWAGACSPLSLSICVIDFRRVPEMIFSKWLKSLMSRVGRRDCCGRMAFGVCELWQMRTQGILFLF